MNLVSLTCWEDDRRKSSQERKKNSSHNKTTWRKVTKILPNLLDMNSRKLLTKKVQNVAGSKPFAKWFSHQTCCVMESVFWEVNFACDSVHAAVTSLMRCLPPEVWFGLEATCLAHVKAKSGASTFWTTAAHQWSLECVKTQLKRWIWNLFCFREAAACESEVSLRDWQLHHCKARMLVLHDVIISCNGQDHSLIQSLINDEKQIVAPD